MRLVERQGIYIGQGCQVGVSEGGVNVSPYLASMQNNKGPHVQTSSPLSISSFTCSLVAPLSMIVQYNSRLEAHIVRFMCPPRSCFTQQRSGCTCSITTSIDSAAGTKLLCRNMPCPALPCSNKVKQREPRYQDDRKLPPPSSNLLNPLGLLFTDTHRAADSTRKVILRLGVAGYSFTSMNALYEIIYGPIRSKGAKL
jgi:hypothetical protein